VPDGNPRPERRAATIVPVGPLTTKEERRELLAYWWRVGVVDADGRVTDKWWRRVGALAP
jgi:hypothetical protein